MCFIKLANFTRNKCLMLFYSQSIFLIHFRWFNLVSSSLVLFLWSRFITGMYSMNIHFLSCSGPRQQPPPLGRPLNSTAIELSWGAPDSPNSNALIYTLLRDSEVVHVSYSQFPFGQSTLIVMSLSVCNVLLFLYSKLLLFSCVFTQKN